jgi:AraC-like DNA-binding protein
MNAMTNINVAKYIRKKNKDEKNWGINIHGVGFQEILPNTEYPNSEHPAEYYFDPEKGRRINSYAIIYITHGGGTFNSEDTDEIEVKQGDIITIVPNHWHTYKPNKKTGWNEHWVVFEGEVFARAINTISDNKCDVISIGLSEDIIKLFHLIQQYTNGEENDNNPCSQQLVCGMLLHLIGIIFYNVTITEKDFDRYHDKIKQACAIMKETIYSNLSLEDIASELNMGYSNFRKIFKKYMMITPYQYLTNIKTETAKELLKATDMQIQEIATKLGFESPDHFSFFFKRNTNQTPMQYRRKSRG